ncbi:L,D-transpeptidase family protein [Luteolibacter sp. SL250]|uniref:L,D-transpeptidase family protein n=1 Tax=Luteolibacter sp. SL250 TaxID=2995170 RepID=UPI002271CF49|nr:L,D-transpeptidase family protein [Luteolibacter sp. SL250]WAC21703.1 L,D-transpeptidase family protein [Luteolibacter sp. SL250]
MRLIALISALLAPLVSAFELPANSSQCIVGIAEGWNSSNVTLTVYEKRKGKWAATGAPWTGRLGKNGLAWGLGLHPNPKEATLKKEGDMRSPAGVYDLGGAWGYDKSIQKNAKLPYRQITSRDLWVEDPQSPSYNRNILLDREPSTPWEKKQQMKQNDYPQSLKLFISHNAPPRVVPNGGSSIFFHIWRGEGSRATAGCTTMQEGHLRRLIAGVDPARRPVYVLLPKAEYDVRRAEWKLP